MSRFFSKYWLVQEKHVSALVKKTGLQDPHEKRRLKPSFISLILIREKELELKLKFPYQLRKLCINYYSLFLVYKCLTVVKETWSRPLEAITFVTDSNINPTTPIWCLRRSNCQKRSSSAAEERNKPEKILERWKLHWYRTPNPKYRTLRPSVNCNRHQNWKSVYIKFSNLPREKLD